jgi:hypothetical protein
MYKKITHNITEEHFAHPIAAELKKKVDKIAPKSTPLKPTLRDMITISPEQELHMTSHELFGKIVWGVRNYIISELNSAPDTTYITTRLMKDIKEFAPVFTKYYSKKVGDDVVSHLTQFATALVELVTTAKADKDITRLTAMAYGHLDDLSNIISVVNPAHWPEAVVKEFWHVYLTHVIEQVKSRIKKDWEADTIASIKASNVLTSGPVTEGYIKGMPDFASIFADGIIKQFPAVFTSPK